MSMVNLPSANQEANVTKGHTNWEQDRLTMAPISWTVKLVGAYPQLYD